MQVAWWDPQYAGAELIPNAKIDSGDPSVGPLLPPGSYTIRVTVDGQSQTTQLKVLPDPRVNMTDAQYKEQADFALSIRDNISQLTRMIKQVQSVRNQLTSRNALLKDNAAAAQMNQDSQTLVEKLNDLESQMQNPKAEVVYDILAFQGGSKLYSRMAFVYGAVIEADGVPTQGEREVYADQKKEFDAFDAKVKQIISTDLTALNATAKKLDLPTVFAP